MVGNYATGFYPTFATCPTLAFALVGVVENPKSPGQGAVGFRVSNVFWPFSERTNSDPLVHTTPPPSAFEDFAKCPLWDVRHWGRLLKQHSAARTDTFTPPPRASVPGGSRNRPGCGGPHPCRHEPGPSQPPLLRPHDQHRLVRANVVIPQSPLTLAMPTDHHNAKSALTFTTA